MSRDIIQSEKYKGYTINIEYDTDPEDPRSWDNVGALYTWVRGYNIGDKHDYTNSEELLYALADIDVDTIEKELTTTELIAEIEKQGTVILPVYAYIHSGITISTSSYSDAWDSGLVGWVFINKEEIENEWGIGPDAYVKATSYLESSIQTYDTWLRGEIYTWSVEETGECVCGYYSIEEAISEAQGSVDYYVKQRVKKHLQKLKEWVRNRVPLIYRKPLQII